MAPDWGTFEVPIQRESVVMPLNSSQSHEPPPPKVMHTVIELPIISSESRTGKEKSTHGTLVSSDGDRSKRVTVSTATRSLSEDTTTRLAEAFIADLHVKAAELGLEAKGVNETEMMIASRFIGMAIARIFVCADVIDRHNQPAPVAEKKASTAEDLFDLADNRAHQHDSFVVEEKALAVGEPSFRAEIPAENQRPVPAAAMTVTEAYKRLMIHDTMMPDEDVFSYGFCYWAVQVNIEPPGVSDQCIEALRIIANDRQSAYLLDEISRMKSVNPANPSVKQEVLACAEKIFSAGEKLWDLAEGRVHQQTPAMIEEKAPNIEKSTSIADAALEQIPVVVPENEPVVEKVLYRAKAPGEWKRRESPQKEDPKNEQSTLNGSSEVKVDESRIITIPEHLARPSNSRRKEAVPATREEIAIANLGDIAKYCPSSVLRPLQDCHLEGCTMPKLCWGVFDCGQEHSPEFSHALQKILPLSFHKNTCNIADHGINRNQWDNVAWSIRWDIYSLVKAHETGRYDGVLIKDPASGEDQETTFEEVKNNSSVPPEWKEALVDNFWAEVQRKGKLFEGFKLENKDTLHTNTPLLILHMINDRFHRERGTTPAFIHEQVGRLGELAKYCPKILSGQKCDVRSCSLIKKLNKNDGPRISCPSDLRGIPCISIYSRHLLDYVHPDSIEWPARMAARQLIEAHEARRYGTTRQS